MSTSGWRRLVRPLFLTATAGTAIGGGIIYYSYRPVNIPGNEAPAVPLRFAADGSIAPPRFPHTKTREEQIAELRGRGGSGNSESGLASKAKALLSGFTSNPPKESGKSAEKVDDGYDLLVIGGGATGCGIALDAATRGLKVAMVERDDFSSGTSSKSTKLVHGGVRYLEKAVWELDYNQ